MEYPSWKENGKIKLAIIVGTRPEIIRLAAVIKKCRKYFDTQLWHTGQNYDYNLKMAEKYDIRVTHNDTKTNNILFDRDTLDPLVIIDLDTCMPGLACYDFGDTIRFAACTAEEDQVEGMKLDLNLMRAYTEGYLPEMRVVLSDTELESLATGAAVITLELASRFLGDYLVGDKYFRIDSPDQNLRRAKAQLALFQDMMVHMEDMKRIIREVAAE